MSAPSVVGDAHRPHRVAIVGGGLAGIAVAVALCESKIQQPPHRRLQIELFESRRMLGGRATSYRDPHTGDLIDHCQHVSLGCCTNFDDLCRRTKIDHLFDRETSLNFAGPDGRLRIVARSRWLPAPLHLAPSLVRLRFLSWRDRLGIVRAMRRLASARDREGEKLSFQEWLQEHNQSPTAFALFWSPVIVSALSEDVERASLPACRKVFVDAFLRHARGFELRLPRVPLRSLYEDHLGAWLESRGVKLHLRAEVRSILLRGERACSLAMAEGDHREFDSICLAVPWYRVGELFDAEAATRLPFLAAAGRFQPAPITSVHLWCSEPISLPRRHLVLPGGFSQWVFDRTLIVGRPYYQIVISASRQVAVLSQEEVLSRVYRELEGICGRPIRELVVRSKVITEHRAVFSPVPDSDQLRPLQKTPISNLYVAGDWTATGWPATMEGAVRSGYLAAEALLGELGERETFLAADLRATPVTRWLFGIR
jgi:squalene-associated FAD-dependent desaturase